MAADDLEVGHAQGPWARLFPGMLGEGDKVPKGLHSVPCSSLSTDSSAGIVHVGPAPSAPRVSIHLSTKPWCVITTGRKTEGNTWRMWEVLWPEAGEGFVDPQTAAPAPLLTAQL